MNYFRQYSQTRCANTGCRPTLSQCWVSFADAGPTLGQSGASTPCWMSRRSWYCHLSHNSQTSPLIGFQFKPVRTGQCRVREWFILDRTKCSASFRRTKTNNSNWELFKWAVTAVWLCFAAFALCIVGAWLSWYLANTGRWLYVGLLLARYSRICMPSLIQRNG